LRLVVRLMSLCVLAVVLAAACAQTAAAQTYVDRRVSAIPSSVLLTRDLPQLVDPRRQRASRQLDVERRSVFFLWVGGQVLALIVLWRSGYAARLRDALSRTVPNPVVVRFLFGASVATVAAVAALPAILIDHRASVVYDLTREPALLWTRDLLLSWVLTAVVFGILSAFVYTLVGRTRLWYAYVAVGLFALVLGADFVQPVVVAPLFDRFQPLSGNARAAVAIVTLERKAGVETAPILVDERSRRSASVAASVTGLGPTKRIVLSDTLLQNATEGEIAFITAHEIGHYVHGDVFRLALAQTLAFVLTVAIAVFIADRLGFRRDDDALSRLPLAGAMIGLVALVVFPIYNAYSRTIEADADRYALALTGDPAAAVRLYVRYADESLTPVCVSASEGWYFLTYPPLGERAATASGRPDPCR
jgi:STE24 endopeptidase